MCENRVCIYLDTRKKKCIHRSAVLLPQHGQYTFMSLQLAITGLLLMLLGKKKNPEKHFIRMGPYHIWIPSQ